jgi:predicted AlkP superfamily phosphohydrolase/phosphomutase
MTESRRGPVRPVLMIALDAAEPRLIERWTDDGSLPTLKRLRDAGAYGRLASSADWLVGSPWPTFYTGTTPGDHGFYHYLAWRAAEMAAVRPSPDHLPLRPFWRALSAAGPRAIAVDIPLTYEPEPFNGIEISNYATHEALVPTVAHPPTILQWAVERAGPPPRADEEYGLQSVDQLLRTRDEQSHGAERVSALAAALMRDEPWDLFLLGIAATHRGGHKLWDETGVAGEVPAAQRAELTDALRQVYIASDGVIARVLEQAGPDVTTMVFSLHGMGPNTCRTELLPEMLTRVLSGRAPDESGAKKPSLVKRLRERIPNHWRHAVKRRLPPALQDRLTAFWRIGRVDWSATRAFSLVADLQGYIRINLRGREAEGVVEPGAEYDRLCEEIADGLRSFVDADTGESIVHDVARADALYPDGARRSELPDLLVKWAFTPFAAHRRIVSPRFGAIDMEAPGRNPSGRSGNHRPEGFLIAAGPGVRQAPLDGAHILDLAPTAYDLLGVPQPPEMRGRPIALSGVEARSEAVRSS